VAKEYTLVKLSAAEKKYKTSDLFFKNRVILVYIVLPTIQITLYEQADIVTFPWIEHFLFHDSAGKKGLAYCC
jgi:hypothetical protein